ARLHHALELVPVEREHHLARVDHIAGNDVEALAGSAIQEAALVTLAAAMLDGCGHLLAEHTDPAVAVERHADSAGGCGAGEAAAELGALVLAGDDLAGADPLAFHAFEELLVPVGAAQRLGLARASGGYGHDRQQGEQECAFHQGTRTTKKRFYDVSEP